MCDTAPPAPTDIHALRAAVTVQGGLVRQLKKDGAPADEIAAAVERLKELKIAVELEAAKEVRGDVFNRAALEDLLKRRMFVVPSFEIYGGVAGLYDYGPPACGFKQNVVDFWKRHFILEEGMLEIECTTMTAEVVLKTSGHVDKFSDLMVKSEATGEYFRADKLLEDHIDNLIQSNPTMPQAEVDEHRRVQRQADAYSEEELGALLTRYNIKAPGSGSDLSAPYPFNLMFKTNIGPEAGNVGYLRPETAQGMFVNFRRLLDYNGGHMPFAAAQVGLAFRNEISPRNFLLRVREFQMAEIEHFVNPRDKRHAKFGLVENVPLVLFPRHNQMTDGRMVSMSTGAAVASGLIDNQTLAYFMARTQLFAQAIGLKTEKLRFRQHLSTEMAHYASDCWDLEVQNSYGWIECVGHADRACYDLMVHAKKAKVDNVASERFAEPRDVEVAVMRADKALMGRQFKKANAAVQAALEELTAAAGSPEEEEAGGSGGRAMAVEAELAANGSAVITDAEGNEHTLTRAMVSWERKTKRVVERKFTPSVIEPSYGIGRLVYSALEHAFYLREGDEKRGVMAFAPAMAPIKCSVLPLSSNAAFSPHVDRAQRLLLDAGLACKVDSSNASIGRRYARADELGTPFAVTVDFTTAAEGEAEARGAGPPATVTLRERDSCAQVRLSIVDAVAAIRGMCTGSTTWADVAARYPNVAVAAEVDESKEE